MQNIMLDDFEGPLDLLLHLIKVNDLDIYDIKIAEITNQYLTYLKQMEQLDLDIASEYLTMATELIYIKSASLLPKPVIVEDDEPINDLKDLQKRLLVYQTYKEASNHLQLSEQQRKQYLTKLPSLVDEYTDGIVSYTHETGDINSLVDAFQAFLIRVEEERPLETKVTNREITQEDRRRSIKTLLLSKTNIKFHELFEFNNKQYIVITFLTVLEMYKKQEIKFHQEHNFGEITIEKGERL